MRQSPLRKIQLPPISHVEFYVSGSLIGRVNRNQTGNVGNTYSFTWTPTIAGNLHVTTRVVDTRGTGVFSGLALYSGGITAFVSKQSQTISFTPSPPTSAMIGTSIPIVATASSNLTVVISSATPSVCTVTGATATPATPQTINLLAGGTCTLHADQAGNSSYHPAPRITANISVGKQSQTITNVTTNPASPIAFQANPANNVIALSATGGASNNPISFASQTPSVCSASGSGGGNGTATILTVGTCTLTANQAGNASYDAAPTVTISLTIGLGTQTITNFNPPSQLSGAVGDTLMLSAMGGASGNAVTFAASPAAVCTLSASGGSGTTNTSLLTIASLGSCTVTANQAGNANYQAAQEVSVTITFVAPSTQIYYIHPDHLGTPRVITKASDNTKVWEWKNEDAFGANAPNEDPSNTGANFKYNLRFPGQYFDSETNTYYNYFRDYDPSTGRYVQSDPIGLAGGLSTFGYVSGAPLNSTDVYGLSDNTQSNAILRAIVPGQAAWDRARSHMNQGNYGWAALDTTTMVTEQVLAAVSFGAFQSFRSAAQCSTNAVIGRVKDLKNLPDAERSLLNRLPNLGSPKANWKQNSGVLRDEMSRGLPIRDASVGDTAGKFLNAERALLQERGWTFNAQTNFWSPPK